MTNDEIRSFLTVATQDECAKRCLSALDSASVAVSGMEPGEVTANEAHRVFSIRLRSLQKAKVEHCGFEGALSSLQDAGSEETVRVVHLAGVGSNFTLFIRAGDGAFLGCIGVFGS